MLERGGAVLKNLEFFLDIPITVEEIFPGSI